jgi:rhomboid protease GluP
MPDWKRIPVTTLLLAAIVAVYLAEVAAGGSENSDVLLRFGANLRPLVLEGQVWRLVACMFLHIGILHLALNGWALFQLGGLFELLIGSRSMLVVYFVTGIAASLASVVFTRALSAGASGAIFGLLGALITFLLRRRSGLLPRGKSLLSQLLTWAAINVVLGFNMAGIDNAGHLGGCACGLLLGLFLTPRPQPPPPPQPWPEPPSAPTPNWPNFPDR